MDFCGSTSHAGNFTPLLALRTGERTLSNAIKIEGDAAIPAAKHALIALHIAYGIEYVQHQGFVHGEISSRLCFVDASYGWTTRIAVARVTYRTKATNTVSNGCLQIARPRATVTLTTPNLRWLPPEVVIPSDPMIWLDFVDIWSFGVVIWCVGATQITCFRVLAG